MGKDRFSRFKKSNYNYDFRYGNNSMNYNVIPNREDLNEEQRKYVIELISKLPNKSDKKFLRSILERGKVPTAAQKKIIQSMVDKSKKK